MLVIIAEGFRIVIFFVLVFGKGVLMTRPPQRKREGFTLIELLIVITIIAILASMSFGAYQKVREAAGRINCVNNIRALGVGMSNYYSSALRYPNGISPNGFTFYWTIRDQMDVSAPTTGTVPIVGQYLCPSRRGPSTVSNPSADYGYSNNPNSILGYRPPGGKSGGVKQEQITDGIGNTILLGHIGIMPQDYAGGGFDSPWKTCSQYARTPAPLYLDRDVPSSSSSMGSPHASAVPHLFADGSVATIDYDFAQANPGQGQVTQGWQFNRKAGTLNIQLGNR